MQNWNFNDRLGKISVAEIMLRVCLESLLLFGYYALFENIHQIFFKTFAVVFMMGNLIDKTNLLPYP